MGGEFEKGHRVTSFAPEKLRIVPRGGSHGVGRRGRGEGLRTEGMPHLSPTLQCLHETNTISASGLSLDSLEKAWKPFLGLLASKAE